MTFNKTLLTALSALALGVGIGCGQHQDQAGGEGGGKRLLDRHGAGPGLGSGPGF